MLAITRNILEFVIAIFLFWLTWRRLGKGFGTVTRMAFIIMTFCAIFLAMSISNSFIPKQTVTITALNEKDSSAKAAQVFLKAFKLNGHVIDMPQPSSGKWLLNDKSVYCWYEPGSDQHESGDTQSISFEFEINTGLEAVFLGNYNKGKVEVNAGLTSQVIDTYVDSKKNVEISTPIRFDLSDYIKAFFNPFVVFSFAFVVFAGCLYIIALQLRRIFMYFVKRYKTNGLIARLIKYKFLFEELVKRDFKKKYKDTVLGMAWSVISPLLTLFVMKIVFTQFFGRSATHYTIYLFCGNLVYTYFKESTTQGMLSLKGNAGIIAKVNVPKYLFLLSKNVQTLINFGLTLCVFFTFCVFDHIEFTWKFVLLLIPITSLVLFNIGVGMILSALYVFFRDVQYLWSVFTLLLMYLSAIFYYIDRYSEQAQYLFLLNPVYLHIRYFRKIVIDSVIPRPEFHMLMLFDDLVVLLLGRWIYKKYNTEFLYYL